MHFQGQLWYKFAFGTFLMLLAQSTAELLTDEATLSNLYNNLLQREYAGPVTFPNRRVERKAQRSPSLRLRFGRRSDPDVLPHSLEKRWFDEVNQKPIRSPSLRLRFGRRSDPSMPIHSAYDLMMMNDQQTPETNGNDYNDIYNGYYERMARKPQRLRFGRSLPFQAVNSGNENQLNNDVMDNDNDDLSLINSEDDFYNNLMHSQKLRSLLMSLKQYGNDDMATAGTSLEEDADEFERAIRKPGPLRLRWGRSTGVKTAAQVMIEDKNRNDLEQKKKLTDITNDVEKTLNNSNKD